MSSSIGYVEAEGSFTLSYKGRKVLVHSARRPCFGIGRGDFSYRIAHGMYHITKDRAREWTEAKAFEATWLAGGLTLDFPGLASLEVTEHEGRLRLALKPASADANRFEIRFALPREEAIYGCGEQYSYLDLRGKKLALQVTEPGAGRGPNYLKVLADLHSGTGGWRDHSYFPLPTFVTTGGLSFRADCEAYSVFDFRKPGEARLSFREIPPAFDLGLAEDLAGAVSELSGLLGRQGEPPAWCYEGAWIGAQGGRDVAEAKLDKALAAGAKVAALWCQDWQGIRITPFGKQLFWNWKWDESLYPRPAEMIEDFHRRGVRFLGYINPMIAMDAPMFQEGEAAGHFVRTVEGGIYETKTTTFPVAVLDLSSEAARTWYKDIIKRNLIGGGLDGWMADFGEYLPPDAVLSSGGDAAKAHNAYAAEWARVNREAVAEAGALDRVTFFCRSGWKGSPANALLFWAGDQLVNFWRDNGLPSALNAGLQAGMSGVGMWHFDVGGFITLAWIRRDRELLARSAEFAAFTQFFRSHEGINPKANVQFDTDEATLAHFARMTRVYAALAPYHRALGAEYRETGLPPIRLPGLHYPEDAFARGARDQYLYGRDLMVAPVLRRGARSRLVSLPDDEWIHLWSGREYGKGRHRIAAPLGEPPVFYRKSSKHAELFRGIARKAEGGGTR